MKYTNSANGNMFTDEMKVNLHVLGALVLNRVGGEVDCADIVAIDEAGGGEGMTKFLEKLP